MTPKEILEKENLTAVFTGENIYKSTKRGVAPLLYFLDNSISVKGYSAIDKVVGAGAAYLYVKLEIGSVYAGVLSKNAEKIFLKYNINYTYGKLVDYIENRDKTGCCPIETAVINAETVDDAITKIRNKLKTLQ